MGKQKGGNKGGGNSGNGGRGNNSSNGKTVDAATLGLGGSVLPTPSLPLQQSSATTPGMNAMNPDMMAMMAMAGAFGGNGNQSTMNVAFNQQQLMQMMTLVQAGNAAQKATEEAAKQKALEDAVAKATQEKTTQIASLEAKIKKKKTRKNDEAETEEPDGDLYEEEDEEESEPKPSKSQKKKLKLKTAAERAQAEKAQLELDLAQAKADIVLAEHKASLMETTMHHLKADAVEHGTRTRLRSASDGAIVTGLQTKIQEAEEKAKLSTPVKLAVDEIVAAQLALIRQPAKVAPINLDTPESPSPKQDKRGTPVRIAPEAKYKDLSARIAKKKKASENPPTADTEQEGVQSKIKLVLQVLDSCLAKINKGSALDTVVAPDDEDQQELEECVKVLVAPYTMLAHEDAGAAKTELVEGLGNKYGIHMKSNDPEEFMYVVLYNMIWEGVFVENEPEFAELKGFMAVATKPVRSSKRLDAKKTKKKK